MAKKKSTKSTGKKSTVTITEVDGKWRLEGTTYIDNDPNKPWPFTFDVSTEEEAKEWAKKHHLVVK